MQMILPNTVFLFPLIKLLAPQCTLPSSMESLFSMHSAVRIIIIYVHQGVHKMFVALHEKAWPVYIRGLAC